MSRSILLRISAGDIASFGADLGVRQSVSLATRLDWCLSEAQEWMDCEHEGEGEEDGGRDRYLDRRDGAPGDGDGDRRGQQQEQKQKRKRRQRWILKPSTLNKGVELCLIEDFEMLRKAVHGSPDIREWVLQEYVGRPLLAEGHKFHLRAYALAGTCPPIHLSIQVHSILGSWWHFL